MRLDRTQPVRGRGRPQPLRAVRSSPASSTPSRAPRPHGPRLGGHAHPRPRARAGRGPPPRAEEDVKRRCPCSAEVDGKNYLRHRLGDRCPRRPWPLPERCASCGAGRWSYPVAGHERCDVCAVALLVASGLTLAHVSRLLGLPVARCRTLLHTHRLETRGPLRIRTPEQRVKYARLLRWRVR